MSGDRCPRLRHAGVGIVRVVLEVISDRGSVAEEVGGWILSKKSSVEAQGILYEVVEAPVRAPPEECERDCSEGRCARRDREEAAPTGWSRSLGRGRWHDARARFGALPCGAPATLDAVDVRDDFVEGFLPAGSIEGGHPLDKVADGIGDAPVLDDRLRGEEDEGGLPTEDL